MLLSALGLSPSASRQLATKSMVVILGQWGITSAYNLRWERVAANVTEFCIDVDDQVLNVTFTPSPDVVDAYAFVKKIEVVSMPSNLYIQEVVSLPLIGQPSRYYIKNLTALEMMYQLNIDEYRDWLATTILSLDIQIKTSSTMSAYVAPEKVYASSRTVAYDASNKNGITWFLPVDSGFYYLVRLHFCEISNEIKGTGQRLFHVYIKDQTADDPTDIFLWSHGVGVPIYRDYIVYFAEHAREQISPALSLSLVDRMLQGKKGTDTRGSERSTMGKVLWNLEEVWLQQESACLQNNGDGGAVDELSVIIYVNRVYLEGDSDLSPEVEFSEIIAPIGR
ncbi:hypothetical protein F3Y22_tig00111153pilonHSYRG00009 [Hibiscus syriacus]|uniref:Malectin-like domain-containing protein n=1 Tax=Hibiscus syriacus TaxID=106335 RepID=A0A6A2YXR9_HIBSY|nr:hypothetical protein F3Y22_tig00111153pilonHSYRG00009 [Hibiscus syriacus]